MEPYTRNGSFVGRTADFGDSAPYVPGFTTYNTLVYVGGTSIGILGSTSDRTVSLTSLTGGVGTSPQAGDMVIITFAKGFSVSNVGVSTEGTSSISGYTTIASIANTSGQQRVRAIVARKTMGSTPDSSITIVGGTGDSPNGGTVAVHVWRNAAGVRGTVTQAISNSAIPTFSSLTVSTLYPNSQIILAAGAGHTDGSRTFGATYLSNFMTAGVNDSNDSTVGMGSRLQSTPGSYAGGSWTWSGTNSTDWSNVRIGFELFATSVFTPPSNAKNSGIWDLHAVYDYKASLIT